MKEYLFVLGRDPELSVAELETYLRVRAIEYKIVEGKDSVIVVELASVNLQHLVDDLGGVQKIAQFIDSFDGLYTDTENKTRFAVSTYLENEDPSVIEDIKQSLKEYFKKEKVKASLKKSHYIQSYLTPSEAARTLEVNVYKGRTAKTVAVSQPKAYKVRDVGRPGQRPLHAISIRLAKILINLSGAKPGDTLLDPFCGVGTILQEGYLMRMHVIGVDSDEWCVKASTDNMKWLVHQYPGKATYRILRGNAREIWRAVSSVDYVITEPYMGPILKNYPRESEARATLKELQPMYADLIAGLAKVAKHGVVLIAPRFKTRARTELGLTIKPLFTKHGFSFDKPFLYTPPTSRMIREIWVLRK